MQSRPVAFSHEVATGLSSCNMWPLRWYLSWDGQQGLLRFIMNISISPQGTHGVRKLQPRVSL